MADYTIHNGDCLEVMKSLADNSMDCVIADPPFGKKASKGTNGFGSSQNRRYTEAHRSATARSRTKRIILSLTVFNTPLVRGGEGEDEHNNFKSKRRTYY